jgi:hypothetical protein
VSPLTNISDIQNWINSTPGNKMPNVAYPRSLVGASTGQHPSVFLLIKVCPGAFHCGNDNLHHRILISAHHFINAYHFPTHHLIIMADDNIAPGANTLNLTLANLSPVTDNELNQILTNIPNDTEAARGPVSGAQGRFDREKASIVFGTILVEGLGTGLAIALAWDGTRWLLSKPDGSVPLVGEVAGSLVYVFTQPACEGFVQRVMAKLTGHGKFSDDELTNLQTLLKNALHSAVGGTIIGVLYSAAKWIHENGGGHQYGWEVAGITLGFFALAGYSFLVDAYGFRQNFTGTTDNRPLKAILTEASKRALLDFFSFKHWLQDRGPKLIAFGTLAFWIGPYVESVAGQDPSDKRLLITNITLLTLFFGEYHLAVSLLARGVNLSPAMQRDARQRLNLPAPPHAD